MKIYRLETRHDTNPHDGSEHSPSIGFMDTSRPTPWNCGSFRAISAAYAAATVVGKFRPNVSKYVCGVRHLDDLGLWFDMQAILQTGKSADYMVTEWETDDYYTCQGTGHDCAGQVVFYRTGATLLDTMRVGEYVMLHTEVYGSWTGYVKRYLY